MRTWQLILLVAGVALFLAPAIPLFVDMLVEVVA